MSNMREEGNAAEDLAVVWAVVRLIESMPASVDDRLALEDARVRLLELAACLGTDEVGLKDLLGRRYNGGVDGGPSKRFLQDVSA